MVVRGKQGDTGRTGDPGRIGDTGRTGDPGPAGDTGTAGEAGAPGETGPKGISGNVAADRRLMWVMIWATVAYLFLAGVLFWNQARINGNADDIAQNNIMISRLVYQQCTDRNADVARQNQLIDVAIATEKHRTKPNTKAIRDLTAFKGTLSDCGRKP